jgi:hypothetical protein
MDNQSWASRGMSENRDPESLVASRTALRRLRESGFQTQREEYDAQAFGNIVIDLASADLEIRFTRDRGQYFISVRKVGETEWFNEHTVLSAIGAATVADALVKEKWASPDAVAAAVYDHLATIRRAFSGSEYSATKATLNAIERESAFRRFGDVTPN